MDADGTPLREAHVVISNSRSKISFSKNEAIFRSVVSSGPHTVTVTTPGFGEKTVEVVVSDGRLSHVTVVMGARHVADMQTESWLKKISETHHSIATVITCGFILYVLKLYNSYIYSLELILSKYYNSGSTNTFNPRHLVLLLFSTAPLRKIVLPRLQPRSWSTALSRSTPMTKK